MKSSTSFGLGILFAFFMFFVKDYINPKTSNEICEIEKSLSYVDGQLDMLNHIFFKTPLHDYQGNELQ